MAEGIALVVLVFSPMATVFYIMATTKGGR